MAVNLYDEFSRCCPDQAQIDAMIKAGISAKTMAKAGPVGVAKVQFGKTSFEFGGGTTAMIIPAYDGDFLIDLIAADAKHSTRFAGLRGRAWCLGRPFDPWEPTEPLPIWRTPLTWLRQGADGVVVLDWTRAYWEWPDANLIAESEIHGQEIRNAMKPRPWRGRVMVRKAKAA